MRYFMKYSLLFLLVVCSLTLRAGFDESIFKEVTQSVVGFSHDHEDSKELFLLTTLTDQSIPVNTIHEVSTPSLSFRHLPRNYFLLQIERFGRIFHSRFKFVKSNYLDSSFALKRGMGYYVYVLREIIV